ncbi:anti-sigma factor family protein [Saccharothrix deserti]|uniref:anti-sigma factor family protein n=1 Tax=Saccharothrix deserti TaxID=2593674 RepID=UPI00131ECEA7|nr:zf-HC2 domain-containing protein [Saccharothrix deserti]
MTVGAHDAVTVGCYALGVLDPHERRAVEQHLRGCAGCRADVADFHRVRLVLDDLRRAEFAEPVVDEELPRPSELVLQRALRQIRSERVVPSPADGSEPGPRAVPGPMAGEPQPQHAQRRRWPKFVAAAAVATVVAFGASTMLESGTPAETTTATARAASATETGTGIKLEANVLPDQSASLVKAKVRGLPPGQRCNLVIVGADGQRQIAFTWTTTEKGKADGSAVEGRTTFSPQDVKSIVVETVAGKSFVAADL